MVATKTMKCGFCDTGAHARCPWGVANGDGKIVICICRNCHDPEHRRCIDCGNRRAEEVGDVWKCLDRDACAAEQQRKIDANPFVQQMSAVRASREAVQALAGVRTTLEPTGPPETPRSPAPRAARDCLCECGGQTKGGKFLPGHDSKYLNSLVAQPGGRTRKLAYAVSEAFGGKYDKRVSNA